MNVFILEAFAIMILTAFGFYFFTGRLSFGRDTKNCFNCDKPLENKKARLCNACYNRNLDLLPKGWSNTK
uniref:ORF22 n=1 Tax=Nitrosopumilaceae spindle-shaped virus TaxID=3065433 RepID=A0AAT9JF14_9VIRU